MDRPVLSIARLCVYNLMIVTVGLSIFFIKRFGKIVPRGFFCNDEDIMHPFPKRYILDSKHFHTIIYLSEIFIMFCIEFFIHRRKDDKKVKFWRFTIPLWVCKLYQAFLFFTLGILATMLTTTVLKGTLGRLRPYFIVACLPSINCSLPENHHVYHTNFICTNEKFKLNARLSFPSGHASFIMYCCLFQAIYLEKRFNWKDWKMPKLVMQLALILLIFWAGGHRVSTYHHHWDDVTGGFLIGMVCAAFTSVSLYKANTGKSSTQHSNVYLYKALDSLSPHPSKTELE